MRPAQKGVSTFATARFQTIASPQQSKELTASRRSAIVISASGMATGGRVLHHMAAALPDPRNTILFVGYQAAGTRGRQLVDGATEIAHPWPDRFRCGARSPRSIRCRRMPIAARSCAGWATLPTAPRRLCLVHGEPQPMDALKALITERLGWQPSRAAASRNDSRCERECRDGSVGHDAGCRRTSASGRIRAMFSRRCPPTSRIAAAWLGGAACGVACRFVDVTRSNPTEGGLHVSDRTCSPVSPTPRALTLRSASRSACERHARRWRPTARRRGAADRSGHRCSAREHQRGLQLAVQAAVRPGRRRARADGRATRCSSTSRASTVSRRSPTTSSITDAGRSTSRAWRPRRRTRAPCSSCRRTIRPGRSSSRHEVERLIAHVPRARLGAHRRRGVRRLRAR